MKLMVLDGNSVINRAYYGVRALTTKDGFLQTQSTVSEYSRKAPDGGAARRPVRDVRPQGADVPPSGL